ncbi:MAG: DUF4956 domain-containing protein [Propionibacteriaceae bacterium]|nr:DUF4956 domain-containing protein [Propionibacteriaceae bacterium]
MDIALVSLDLVAVLVLVFGLYAPRHHRRDLATAFLGVNLGVLAVSTILAGVNVGIGVGLGLFGVLSIIRLRSDELAQHEIAYYFTALALGLLGGIPIGDTALSGALMAALLIGIFVADHPKVLAKNRRQIMVIDRAIPTESELRVRLSDDLDADILGFSVLRLDQVNDSTTVDVRYRPRAIGRQRAGDTLIQGRSLA